MSSLIFVTGNFGKAKEVSHLLDKKVEIYPLDLPEIQSISVQEVVKDKIKRAYEIIKKPCLCEDTGLSIVMDKTCSFPGALIKFYWQALGADEICKRNAGLPALAETCIGYSDDASGYYSFSGYVKGKIADVPRGSNGFGWDTIFIPHDQPGEENKTFAEMTPEEKNKYSMRAKAILKLKTHLSFVDK